jgi:hypothetical protein
MRSTLQLALLLILIYQRDAVAQQSSSTIAGPVSTRLTHRIDAQWATRPSLAVDTVPRDIRPTHWKEGALIGGLALGVGGAVLAVSLCGSSDTGNCGGVTAGGFLVGAVIGGVSGALIGGQFPKGPEP